MDEVKLRIVLVQQGTIELHLTQHEAEAYLEAIKRTNWIMLDEHFMVNTSHIVTVTILSTEI